MGWLLPVMNRSTEHVRRGEELAYFLSSKYSQSEWSLLHWGDFDMGATCSVGNGTMAFDFQMLLISDEVQS